MDAPSQNRKRRRILRVLAALVGLAALSYLAAVAVLGRPPTWWHTEYVCDQPTSVGYRDGTYAVYVERPRSLALDDPAWEAVISRDGVGDYGVWIELNPSSEAAPKVTCRWSDDAVVIVEPNGIEHRVPATVFTGGR